ncbi:DNA alkylation repair protein [Enterovibrio norvegicus FF-162]|uniref:DNA alkylation repair protein n=1 Tax=Enterovibrio norvegicus FF-454 TaxID=1185651 RepID=A0A1E5BZ21_9GAMM|nr:DNA alkylation repair protein [Enterovibrio norvegicus]OEE58162.1 DNA alkylation repair protein [Enterovibrio norvegicus FF-454]OEE75119.1 DNA alkylation repair protein [Enterovibrio norvegicus FF-162]
MKNPYLSYVEELKRALKCLSSPEKAESSRRYFPEGIHCIGASASDIKRVIDDFHVEHKALSAAEVLCVTEYLLENAEYSEDVLVAFGLINKFVKKNYDDDLILRFEFWLENYASNWSHVDDLCIKTLYQFMLARPHLIVTTQRWAHSNVSWCRRASNVAWVKFVKRKVGKSVYCLDKDLIFQQCDLLLSDDDVFVQKSVGWLLKVTSMHHKDDVITYIENNFAKMTRPTIRYAIEKLDAESRMRLLALTK